MSVLAERHRNSVSGQDAQKLTVLFNSIPPAQPCRDLALSRAQPVGQFQEVEDQAEDRPSWRPSLTLHLPPPLPSAPLQGGQSLGLRSLCSGPG